MGGLAFKEASAQEAGADGEIAGGPLVKLYLNGTARHGLEDETAVIDIGVPVWVDEPPVFTSVPRSILGATFWPGIESRSEGDAGLYFRTEAAGVLFVFVDTARYNATPPCINTRWEQLDEPVEIMDMTVASIAKPVDLTVWSRPSVWVVGGLAMSQSRWQVHPNTLRSPPTT